MNAWGEGPLIELASAINGKPISRTASSTQTPSDDDLSDSIKTDAEFVETAAGQFQFPPRGDICAAILDLLKRGPKSSYEMEMELGRRFNVLAEAQRGNYSPWRYQVSFALVSLGDNDRGTGLIERCDTKPRLGGGTTGMYRLRPGTCEPKD